jgi:hypothetical protein
MRKDVPHCVEGETFFDFGVWRYEEVEKGRGEEENKGRKEDEAAWWVHDGARSIGFTMAGDRRSTKEVSVRAKYHRSNKVYPDRRNKDNTPIYFNILNA